MGSSIVLKLLKVTHSIGINRIRNGIYLGYDAEYD